MPCPASVAGHPLRRRRLARWRTHRPGSFDTIAGPLNNMLDFNQTPNPVLILHLDLGTVANEST
jgi:hypothetical protein